MASCQTILYKADVLHCDLPGRTSFSPAVVVISWFPADSSSLFMTVAYGASIHALLLGDGSQWEISNCITMERCEALYSQQLGNWEKEKLDTTGRAPCLRTRKSMSSNSDYTCGYLIQGYNQILSPVIALHLKTKNKKQTCF